MADINKPPTHLPARPGDEKSRRAEAESAALAWDVIELLFFAYRDFVSDADHVLSAFGFGRAHHRVLHFVYRNPGLTVADLLDVLRITKQSLGRVLKQLLDEAYILQQPGSVDRRQRLLFATPKGEALILKLASQQTARIEEAMAGLDPAAQKDVREFLLTMINPESRDKVMAMIARKIPSGPVER